MLIASIALIAFFAFFILPKHAILGYAAFKNKSGMTPKQIADIEASKERHRDYESRVAEANRVFSSRFPHIAK